MDAKEDTFLPTSECPMYPPNLERSRPRLPQPQLSDADVDAILRLFVSQRPGAGPIPTTQFGRRAAVLAYLALLRRQA